MFYLVLYCMRLSGIVEYLPNVSRIVAIPRFLRLSSRELKLTRRE